jgi:nucleoside-diphosphate-sugar epimerase
MNLLITGGAGFLGTLLARTLLARGTLAGRAIGRIELADLFAPPADLLADGACAHAPARCSNSARR